MSKNYAISDEEHICTELYNCELFGMYPYKEVGTDEAKCVSA